MEGLNEVDVCRHFGFLRASDSLEGFLSEGMLTYLDMLNICQKNNISKVYDVGCGFGWQSEIFWKGGVKYLGIDVDDSLSFWKNNAVDGINYINKEYPFSISADKDEALISSMCLSWECYFRDKDTLKKQAEAVIRDFDQAILVLADENADIFIQGFKKCEIISDNEVSKFVYLSS